MNIEKVDPNFKLDAGIPAETEFYDPRRAPFSLWGLAKNDEGSYCRLPLTMLPECSEGVQGLAWHLAGGCVRFSTDAAQISVVWRLREAGNMGHFAASGQSGLELFEETDGNIRPVRTLVPQMNPDGCGCALEQSRLIALKGEGMRSYALYLPLYNGVTELLIGLPPKSRLEEGRTPVFEKPILFYGSSITQGGCASKVCNAYTHVLARRLDAALCNLGFSGNGCGEQVMARYIASLPMSAFVLDYDHNASSPEHLEATHEAFFLTVREAQPDLPVLMLSKPDFDTNPGSTVEVNARRREIIRRTYQNALARGDRRVWFVDGETFFGDRERFDCAVDGCHPTDLGFRRMADVLEPVLREALGLK